MIKVLAIYGGPRRNNNTEYLLNAFLKEIDSEKADIDVVILKDLEIAPCTSCYGCSKSGECIIEDDMTELYSKIKSSDVIILASPIYFGSVSTLTKAMIDRCQAFWSAKYLANKRNAKSKKRGYFIATAGAVDEKMFEHVEYTVKMFFAACDADYTKGLLASNTDKVPVNENINILKEAGELARNIAK